LTTTPTRARCSRPATLKVVDSIARAGHVPMHAMNAAQAKAAYAAAANVLELPVQKLARVEDFTIPARDGNSLPARHYAPTRRHLAGAAVLARRRLYRWQHSHPRRLVPPIGPPGGLRGGVAGLPAGARRSKFPTAHEDSWDALQWIAHHGAARGLDGARVAIGGDSAGGTLSAACAIEARDHALPLALQLLFYPGCAGHQNTASHKRFAKGFVLDEANITYFFEQYIRTPADRDDWRFAPLNGLRAGRIRGRPERSGAGLDRARGV